MTGIMEPTGTPTPTGGVLVVPEMGCRYELIAPDGSASAVFNDTADSNYVGVLSEIGGFDSAEVNEAFVPITEGDGGLNLPFFNGRRPVTMNGLIYGHATILLRNQKEDRLMRASNALRSDATLRWQPTGGPMVRLLVRRQNPLRITGAWVKEFQMSLVSESPFIEADTYNTLQTAAGTTLPQGLSITNQGSARAFPELIRIHGPVAAPQIINDLTGEVILKINTTLSSSQAYDINIKTHTVMEGSTSRYAQVDFLTSTWAGLIPGAQTVRLYGTGGGAQTFWRIDWRDTWA